MSEKTQHLPRYINQRDILLQNAKDYYEKKKKKKKEYARSRYRNMSQEQENILAEYRRE